MVLKNITYNLQWQQNKYLLENGSQITNKHEKQYNVKPAKYLLSLIQLIF